MSMLPSATARSITSAGTDDSTDGSMASQRRCTVVWLPAAQLAACQAGVLGCLLTSESALSKLPEGALRLLVTVGGEGDRLESLCGPLRPHLAQQQLDLRRRRWGC
jgi:hypothetical protein